VASRLGPLGAPTTSTAATTTAAAAATLFANAIGGDSARVPPAEFWGRSADRVWPLHPLVGTAPPALNVNADADADADAGTDPLSARRRVAHWGEGSPPPGGKPGHHARAQ